MRRILSRVTGNPSLTAVAFSAAVAFGFATLPLLEARAEETERSVPKVAIQRLKYKMAHEIALSLGTMPLDPFQKGLAASLSYTLHFDEYFSWEMVNVAAAHLLSTNLRDELIDTFAIPEEDFAAPRFVATSGILLSPLYGKQTFLNGAVVHQGVFLGLHGGVMFGDRATLAETFSDLRPTVGAGIGYRLFLTKLVSFRLDFRDFFAFRSAIRSNESVRIENVLFITGAISFNFWRDDA